MLNTQTFDAKLHLVANLKVNGLRLVPHTNTGRGASGNDVAWLKSHELRKVGDKVSHTEHHSIGVAVLSALSVHV